MFDLDNPRKVPFWLPLAAFALAGILYAAGVWINPEFKAYALTPLPLALLSLSIYLRTPKSP